MVRQMQLAGFDRGGGMATMQLPMLRTPALRLRSIAPVQLASGSTLLLN